MCWLFNPSFTPIKQVDTILLVVDEANDVNHLMSVFSEMFQLPVSWPAMELQTSFSGCVYAGNVNLEPIAFLEDSDRVLSRIGGIGFEIETALIATLEEIKRREIPYTGPYPFTVTDSLGQAQTHYSTAVLDQLSSPQMSNYLCEYKPIAFSLSSTPTIETVTQQKALLKQTLENRSGGPLGLQYVEEIVVGARNLTESRRRWQKLFDPIPPRGEGVWKIGVGPQIRVVPAMENEIQSLVIKVSSLAKARTFLIENGLFSHGSDRKITLVKEQLHGLEICLV
jgi:hypothetical protein